MAKQTVKRQATAKRVPPAEYTGAEYDIAVRIVPRRDSCRPQYRPLVAGKPLKVRGFGSNSDTCSEAEPQRSLDDALRTIKRELFRDWDEARVKALGGISETVRYNADQKQWEALQTFRQQVILPLSHQTKWRRAIAARKRAEKAAFEAREATRGALQAIVGQVGLSLAEAGQLLGLSKQRVAQLLADG